MRLTGLVYSRFASWGRVMKIGLHSFFWFHVCSGYGFIACNRSLILVGVLALAQMAKFHGISKLLNSAAIS